MKMRRKYEARNPKYEGISNIKIKKLNEETAQLKQYIRLNTGKMGQEWYARLEQRRLTSS